MLQTSLSQLLNIECAIIQAPIGSAVTAQLAAGVSNAGGLGTLALTWKSNEVCLNMIKQTKLLTSRPFAVNLLVCFEIGEKLKICINEKVPVIIFSWGDGSTYINELRACGIKVGQTVSTSDEALDCQKKGFDFLIAQGWEAGGHVMGSTTSIVLVPSIYKKTSIPFAAAGGIADGKGILAALALGADGVMLGTRFLMSEEAAAHASFQQIIAKASDADTVYAERLFNLGWDNAPHRIIRNSTTKLFESRTDLSGRPGEDDVVGFDIDNSPVKRYSDIMPLKGMLGDVEAMALYAGQSAGLIDDVLPVADIMKALNAELYQELSLLNQRLYGSV